MNEITFEKFTKIPRLTRECIITEKIDGTNAQIYIVSLNTNTNIINDFIQKNWIVIENGYFTYGILVGSRNKWLSPNKDNYGFASWVNENKNELIKLGPGRHYGEWWGLGIQRRYDQEEKHFSLFNVHMWKDDRPSCCSIVPVLYEGIFSTLIVDSVLKDLEKHGSYASPSFMEPEGIVIYHIASGHLYKKTIKNDSVPKGISEL